MTETFSYRAGVLCAEDIPLERIAAEVGTPFYCYSTAQLKKNYRDFADAFADQKAMICYAVKANANQAVIRTFAECGAGADITSVGEMERALAAGIAPEKIVFSGVGKKRDEIAAALAKGIYQIDVESIPELHLISKVAGELKKPAPIALRVNPDVDPHTLAKIATGEKETKFGIELAQLDEAMKLATSLPNLQFKGFAMHIGSQLTDYKPFRLAYKRLENLIQHWTEQGIAITSINIGGGVGIPYLGEKIPPLAEYAAIVREIFSPFGCRIILEPGRYLVGNAGVLVSRVIYAKKAVAKKFLIIDAGMNDLVRPAMYDAYHDIVPVRQPAANTPRDSWDVVGPVCETSDLFDENYQLPDLAQDDLVAIQFAGAYGSAMSSTYNGRPLIPEVLVSGNQYAVVRRRISVAEQIGWESLPPWMESEDRRRGSGIR